MGEKQETTANRHGVSSCDENVSKLVVTVAQYWEYTESHWAIYFKRVNFMLHELYLNKAAIL